jgi:7-carboxy-7-deazaguanine synthase
VRISELFYSIQGEGELAGVPSVFVRTSGCNLRCGWCDTPYASWSPEGTERTIGSILEEVTSHPARHVVLTGGEPMIAREIRELATALRALGKHITIETAATVPPDGIACDLASLSPKPAHSNPKHGSIDDAWVRRHEATRWQPTVVQEWIRSYPFQLKFVFADTQDLAEIESMLDEVGPVPPSKVLLMPEGVQAEILRQRQVSVIEVCKAKGYRYCPRLHIDLFGNKRGT